MARASRMPFMHLRFQVLLFTDRVPVAALMRPLPTPLDGPASRRSSWFAKEKAMTTPFVRPAMHRLQPAAAAPRPGAAGPCMAAPQAQMQAQAPSAMEHAMHLDLRTSWPTHRIRSFLSLQPR